MKKNLIIIMIIAILILNTGCVQDEMINTNNSIKDTSVNNSNTNTSEDNRIINKLKESTFGNHKTSTGSLFSMFETKVDWNVEKQNNSSFVVVRVYKENNTDIDLTFAFGVNGYINNEYFSLEAIITSEGEMTHTERENFFDNMYVVHGLNKMGQIMDKITNNNNEGKIIEKPSTVTERKGKPYVPYGMPNDFTSSESDSYDTILEICYKVEGMEEYYNLTFEEVISTVLIDPYISVQEGSKIFVTINGFFERDEGEVFVELTFITVITDYTEYSPELRSVAIDGEIVNDNIITEMYLKYDYLQKHAIINEVADVDIQAIDNYFNEYVVCDDSEFISFKDVITTVWSDVKFYTIYSNIYDNLIIVVEGKADYNTLYKLVFYSTSIEDVYPYKEVSLQFYRYGSGVEGEYIYVKDFIEYIYQKYLDMKDN